MKKRLLLVVLVLAMLFAGCAAKDESMNYARTEEAPAEMADMAEAKMAEDGGYYEQETTTEETSSSGEIEDYSEKIIYNANLELVADDVEATADKITDQVSAMGGYISYMNKGNYSSSSVYVNMQVRVPAKGLTEFTDYVAALADVEYENRSSDNITEQYYDIKTRLEHQQLQAEQLEKLMEQATTTEDILAVRRELSQVQETVEVYQGKIRMWDSLVSYSTVTINIRKTPTIDDNDGLLRLVTWGETGRAIERGFRNSAVFVVNFFSFLLRLIATLLIPAVIVVPIVILIVKLAKRNKKNKKNRKSKNDGQQ